MGVRRRALMGVLFILMAIVGLPALAAPAAAEPRTVTVAVHPITPFAMKVSDEWAGFTVELWEEIAQRQDWTIEWLEVADVAEQLRAVAEGRADVAAGAVSVTAGRTEQFDFTQPILDAGLQIMVPIRAPETSSPGLMDFLSLLFSHTMLVWLAAAIVITVLPAHVLWLIERRHSDPAIARSYFPGIIQAFGWGLGTLAAQGDTAPRHWIARSMTIVWAFVSIIFVAFYTANLTATLTVEALDAQIKGPSDLYEKSVCTVATTTSSAYLRQIGVDAVGRSTIDDCYHGLRDGEFDAVVFDAPVLRYFVTHAGAGVAAVTGPVFHDEDYAFALALGSPLRKPINQTLLQIREDGSYELNKEKWFGDDQASTAGNPN